MGYENEILLQSNAKIISSIENIKDSMRTNVEMVRTSKGCEYINMNDKSKNCFFWPKCFPDLYPFGRGCPDDVYFPMQKLKN